MAENLRQILRRYADAVVSHLDPHTAFDARDRNLQLPIRLGRILERVLRVRDQVDDDLHDLMPVDEHGR